MICLRSWRAVLDKVKMQENISSIYQHGVQGRVAFGFPVLVSSGFFHG
jgi:hypothetical protein